MTGLTAKRLLSIMFAAESLAMLAAGDPAAASTLRVSTGSAQRAANEVEADYTTSHVLISEKARESVSITIFFDPQVTGVESAEVFTNLNRRDWGTATPNDDASDFDPGPNPGVPAKLRLLWQQAGFKYSKFCPPVVADGKLLVPTFDGNVDVYELN
jgi:outer membrane protein assembly factor BamB